MCYAPYDEMYRKALKVFENTQVQNPIEHKLIKDVLKKRKPDIHKGSCGRLMVCAGSAGLTGAAYMACEAALRTGAGLVTLCCAEQLNSIFEIKLTEAMTLPVKSRKGVISAKAFGDICKKLESSDALLYGPGLTQCRDIKILLKKILKFTKVPVVIDADGINVLSENKDILKETSAPVILTPHIGEFARLTGYDTGFILENYKKLALEFAKEYGIILVLKSHKTVVTDGKQIFENVLGNPGMAVGGSGDVLSGIIASFLAQGNSPFLSALGGVYIHSLAGDMASFETGEYSLLPRDIIRYISYAVRESSLKD